MSEVVSVRCPVCNERIEGAGSSGLSDSLRAHYSDAHKIQVGARSEAALYESREEKRDLWSRELGQRGAMTGEPKGLGPSGKEWQTDVAKAKAAKVDPSSLQSTTNPEARSADARYGLGSYDIRAGPTKRIVEQANWMKGMAIQRSSSPSSTVAPPMHTMMGEKVREKLGMDTQEDTAARRADLGIQSERDRLLHTGAGGGAVLSTPALGRGMGSIIRRGEIGVECPLCGNLIISTDEEGLSQGLRDHSRRDHPRLIEPPIRA